MQQLSRTYQIALGAMLVLLIAWFTVLKPSTSDSSALPPIPAPAASAKAPGQQGLENAVGKARGAVADATSAAAAASPAKAVTPSGASAAAAPDAARAAGSKPARPAEPVDAAAPILRELKHGKVAVLLFYGRGGADDAAVRRALRSVDHRGGRVSVRSAPISRLARYAAITEGVSVMQSPTVLVIGRDRLAHSLVGFVDTRSIDQLVADTGGPALRRRR